MPIFLNNLEINKNQILEPTIHNAPTAPPQPVAGQIYFNTTQNRMMVFNGIQWISMDSADATMAPDDIVQALNAATLKVSKEQVEGLVELEDIVEGKAAIDDLAGKEDVGVASSLAADALSDANDYTDTAIANLIGAAPEHLDTLEELATKVTGNKDWLEELQDLIEARSYSEVIGDGTATEHTITHDLGTRDVIVSIRENSAPYAVVLADVEIATENTVTIITSQPISENNLKVTVVK